MESPTGINGMSFVLKQHNDITVLKKMYKAFKARIDEKNSPLESYDLITAMHKALVSMSGSRCIHLIYWPLIASEYQTKTCVYDQSYESTKQEATCFHLVNMTRLIEKLKRTKDSYVRCGCRNHSKNIRLQWQEYAYPQFVNLLYRHYSRQIYSRPSSPCASPYFSFSTGTSPSSLTWHEDEEDEERRVVMVEEKNSYLVEHLRLNFRIQVNRNCRFIGPAKEDLFSLSSSELARKYGDENIALFGYENVQNMRHFPYTWATSMDYKLSFKLENIRARLSQISAGSFLKISPSTDLSNTVLFLHHCVIRIPAKKNTLLKSYTLCVPSQNKKCMHPPLSSFI
jgi:hypothetical protein